MKLRTLLEFAWPYRGSLAAASLLMLISTAVTLALPWAGGRFASDILERGVVHSMAIVGALLALFAAQALLTYAQGIYSARIEQRIQADLSTRVYEHLQALPLSYHQARRHGDVLALLTSETSQISNYIASTLLTAAPLVVTLAGAIAMMVAIDPWLAAGVGILMPAFYVALKIAGRRMRPLSAQLQQAYAQAVAVAEENLALLPAIKAFTREGDAARRYAQHVAQVEALTVRQQRFMAMLEPAAGFLIAAAVVLLLWLAGSRLDAGTMKPAELITFLLYAAVAARPLGSLASFYGQTQVTRGTLERLESVLNEPAEPSAGEGRPLAEHIKGAISFRNAAFAYPGRSATIRCLNLDIAAGETIALTGHNGSGKTTLVNLLLRFHALDGGTISIDGIDIATLALDQLRHAIGIVPQSVMLFNASVASNIAFGRHAATPLQIEAAAKAAQADAFIRALPQGYDTLVGDQGVRLSGGQRQRIALARALIKNPPILVLDEATAMFDPDGELSFIRDCRDVLSKRTVIIITHRPASLALADRIVTMHEGCVVADVARLSTAGIAHGAS